ncbi:hypothetical protein QTO34_006903 [Cnephaeus nilssonii]|uniref:Uncharacterized protein n=1 Tax=Cnephaeus nilssonii TaxID=3371016 RepID=A0AA40HJA5_CNENI|nr:hypothetical protein QTO34_006903 [Eptesicus nilssonii]
MPTAIKIDSVQTWLHHSQLLHQETAWILATTRTAVQGAVWGREGNCSGDPNKQPISHVTKVTIISNKPLDGMSPGCDPCLASKGGEEWVDNTEKSHYVIFITQD